MLITLKNILKIAEAENIAIGAFNVTSLEGIRALFKAAEELNTPVIVQFANEAHKQYISLSEIGPVMMQYAERSKVPACVHLDHGANLDEIREALELGFTSVMYDGSALTYEKNVAYTNAAVELAESYGASVEAEIGSMGREEFLSAGGSAEDAAVEGAYTDPQQAAQFVEDTGIDALACSFGTVHGIYLSAPKLDFDRIKAIREATGKPVVMHGGSGISDEDFRKCITNGVRKINFYTYAAKFAGEYVKEKADAQKGNVYFHDMALWAEESMKETYLHAIRVFSGKK